MPTLNWIGKEAVVKHHQEVPFRLLEPVPELSLFSPAGGNAVETGTLPLEGGGQGNVVEIRNPLPPGEGRVRAGALDVSTTALQASGAEALTPTLSRGERGINSTPLGGQGGGEASINAPNFDAASSSAWPTPIPTFPLQGGRSGRLNATPSVAGGEGDYSGNLIVQGDNLHALKALLPRYAGQVRCIYIDPPYNTGNEGWVYNDNVNSPEIRRWLGEVVGKEGETLDRHDRWLCMMYPRLVLLRQFLREDGAIFVSIDDNEVAALRLLMDEIFGKRNFVESIIWEKNYAPKASARHFSEAHDYVVVYAFCADKWTRKLVPRSDKQDKLYKNPDNDPRGSWRPNNMAARNYYSKGTYSIVCPSGRVIAGPPKGSYWRISEEKLKELDRNGRIWWGTDGNNVPAPKIFLSEVKQGVVPMSLWPYGDVGHTQEGKRELIELVDFANSDEVFITPKPTRLIQRILQIASDNDSLILDSFAGSGTTGHAVLKQNAEDGGNRRFILVEMDENIARNVTAERVRRVCQGYRKGVGRVSGSVTRQSETQTLPEKEGDDWVPGLGGGFQFCRLSAEPLFDASGRIRPDVTFVQLAEFVWFAETGTGFPAGTARGRDQATGSRAWPAPTPLLGIHEGRAIYLLYNGILKDKSPAGGNVLTGPVFDLLPRFDGPKVIYAAANRMGARAVRENVTFKQTPYALEL